MERLLDIKNKNKIMNFRIKFKVLLSIVLLFLLSLNYSYSQGGKGPAVLLKKWSSGNGTTVFDFRLPDTLFISSLEEEVVINQWKIENGMLLIKDATMQKFDKIAINHLSVDSLVLNVAYPNNEVIFSFKPYVPPTKNFDSDSIVRFLTGKKFIVTTAINDVTYEVAFRPELKISLKGYSQEWRISKNEGYVFVILETEVGRVQCFKVVDVSEKYIDFEADDLSDVDKVIKIRFTVI